MSDDLLTARQLVAELSRRGVGDWDRKIVAHWINEEPPLPIGKRGRPGQAHRYYADDAIAWLRDRDARIGLSNNEAPAGAAPQGNTAEPAADAAEHHTDVAVVDPNDPNAVRQLLAQATAEAAYNPTVEAMLDVLRGRDPRNWKAAEDAYSTRIKRLEALGHLVSVDDMRTCLDSQLAIFRTALGSLRGQLKQAMAELDEPGLRESAVDDEIDQMLQGIADAARSAESAETAHAA